MRAAWRHGEELYADVALPEAARAPRPEGDGPEFVLHPALLDAALHALALDSLVANGSGTAGPAAGGLSLPFAFGGVRVHSADGVRRLRVRTAPGPDGQAGVELTDETGSPVATVRSLSLRPLPRTGSATADPVAGALHRTEWVPLTEPPAPVAMPRWGVLGTAGTRLVDALAPPGSGVACTRARRRATRRRPSSWRRARRPTRAAGRRTRPPDCCGRRTGRWCSCRSGSPHRTCPAPVSFS
ncbi:polyketide synthase dehydratase domain-containing protein [Streptomyces sp. NPDC032161]|uniref:polyketide synthase dehydratase domain-containing protein n=1 Tax=unclassified Streptomyces TaxID=2593676 RepID=UPI0033C44DDB